jgi:Transglycosylase SLT domain
MPRLWTVVKIGAVVAVIGCATGTVPAALSSADPSTTETAAGIPTNYAAMYHRSGHTCPHLDWALLAAIGKVESNHGRDPNSRVPNSAGARGPMQFLPATFDGVRARHPGVGPNVYNPAHAIPAAAHMLCDNGVRSGQVYSAVWSYNHADWYVRKVQAQAAAYR